MHPPDDVAGARVQTQRQGRQHGSDQSEAGGRQEEQAQREQHAGGHQIERTSLHHRRHEREEEHDPEGRQGRRSQPEGDMSFVRAGVRPAAAGPVAE